MCKTRVAAADAYINKRRGREHKRRMFIDFSQIGLRRETWGMWFGLRCQHNREKCWVEIAWLHAQLQAILSSMSM